MVLLIRNAWPELLGLVLLPYLYIALQRVLHRRRDDLFRLVSENAADMIALVEVGGKRLYHSPAYEKVLGYSAKELAATGSLEQVHPQDRGRVIGAGKEARATGVGRRLEYRMRHKDGSWRILESTANPIRNRRGVVTHLVIVNATSPNESASKNSWPTTLPMTRSPICPTAPFFSIACSAPATTTSAIPNSDSRCSLSIFRA